MVCQAFFDSAAPNGLVRVGPHHNNPAIRLGSVHFASNTSKKKIPDSAPDHAGLNRTALNRTELSRNRFRTEGESIRTRIEPKTESNPTQPKINGPNRNMFRTKPNVVSNRTESKPVPNRIVIGSEPNQTEPKSVSNQTRVGAEPKQSSF